MKSAIDWAHRVIDALPRYRVVFWGQEGSLPSAQNALLGNAFAKHVEKGRAMVVTASGTFSHLFLFPFLLFFLTFSLPFLRFFYSFPLFFYTSVSSLALSRVFFIHSFFPSSFSSLFRFPFLIRCSSLVSRFVLDFLENNATFFFPEVGFGGEWKRKNYHPISPARSVRRSTSQWEASTILTTQSFAA